MQLAGKIDWEFIDGEIAPLYSDGGRPGIATQFVIGLFLLKLQKLRIGWEGDVLGLHSGIDRLAPMAQVRALVRKLVLEELLSGEVLEVWVIDPAFAHAFVGQSVNMRDPRQILRPQRPALVRHPQALGQEKFQLAAEATPRSRG